MIDMQAMLSQVVQRDASDLHLIVGVPPMLRIHGQLTPVQGTETEALTNEMAQQLAASIMTPEQKELLNVNKEVDLGYQFGEYGRFRVNVYYQKGCISAALRLIPSKIKTVDELGLPKICHTFAQWRQGLGRKRPGARQLLPFHAARRPGAARSSRQAGIPGARRPPPIICGIVYPIGRIRHFFAGVTPLFYMVSFKQRTSDWSSRWSFSTRSSLWAEPTPPSPIARPPRPGFWL